MIVTNCPFFQMWDILDVGSEKDKKTLTVVSRSIQVVLHHTIQTGRLTGRPPAYIHYD